ncbi:MAG: peptide-methionine (S)-S-oxide reductase MsrA [Gammaproteobacteria bacterium]
MTKFPLLCGLLLLSTTWLAAADEDPDAPAALPAPQDGQQVATFAGGCFWCMEPPFDTVPGVLATTSGYIGGTVANPTYEQVSYDDTGHAEAVQVLFDPSRVTYDQLLAIFWRNIDPTALDHQFCDFGHQYRSEIFYHDEAQHRAAVASREALHRDKPFAGAVVTRISAAGTFYPAENYHQDYSVKNPVRYKYYRYRCGRDQRLEELWGATPE